MKANIQHFQSIIGPVQPILNIALLSLLMWWILRNWLEGHTLVIASLASAYVLNLGSIFIGSDPDERVYKLVVSAATLLVLYGGWHILRRFEDGADG